MRLVAAHARAQTLEYLRLPSFLVPTLTFPSLFFLLWVAPSAHLRPTLFMAAYMGFAVLAIAFFQFGVGIAADRTSPWELYLRTLPVAPWIRFAARVVVALGFAAVAAAVVAATATASTSARLDVRQWVVLAVAILGGSVPFALLGIAIGYWTTPRGALPVANVLYLGLSWAGGLWSGPNGLPDLVERLSGWLPTRQYAELLWGSASGDWGPSHWAWLGLYGVLFAVLAAWGYARDEGQRYR